jgi:hypothetical protein
VARHEVAVRANIVFHTLQPPFDVLRVTPEQVVIGFEGRDFVWHPNLEPGQYGEEWWPSVTVVVEDRNDYEKEREFMQRFLSALSYELRQPIDVLTGCGSGVADPLAPPLPTANRRRRGNQSSEAPAAIEVTDDERLRLVLGLYREGLNSDSPFYRFLSFWNALDAAFDHDIPCIKAFLEAEAPRRAGALDYASPPDDWPDYLYDSGRCAIAHAIRDPGRPVLDPDLPDDRARLHRDSGLLERLVRAAVEQRWPRAVRRKRRF